MSTWKCPDDGIENDANALKCELCDGPKPGTEVQSPVASSLVEDQQIPQNAASTWTCPDDSNVNHGNAPICDLCDKPRPASGPVNPVQPPVIIPAPVSPPIAVPAANKWICPDDSCENDNTDLKCQLCDADRPNTGQEPGQIPNPGNPSPALIQQMMSTSEIPLDVIDYTQDIAKPKVPITVDLEYQKCESELVLKDLELVFHGNTQRLRRREFLQGVGPQGNYSLPSLQNAIKQLYLDVGQNADACLNYHMGFVFNLINQHMKSDAPEFESFRHIGGEHLQPMVLALNFYTGYVDGSGNPFKKASDKVRLATKHAFSTNAQNMRRGAQGQDLGPLIEEVQWWILKALSFIKPVTKPCCRSDYYKEDFLQYFQIGKVFQWMKLSSSNMGVNMQGAWQKDSSNVIFHIYSQTGRSIKFFSSCPQLEDEVLFPPGAEFLVCKIKKDRRSGVNHIFVREIRTGLAQNVICWVDDKLFLAQDNQTTPGADLINFIHAHGFQRNITFILKDRTDIAMAYFQSVFFTEALNQCTTFKLMTNNTRNNEAKGNNEQFYAGPNLVKQVRELMQVYHSTRPQLQTLIFCGNGQQTLQNCLEVGIPQTNMPSISVDANTAVKFCLEA